MKRMVLHGACIDGDVDLLSVLYSQGLGMAKTLMLMSLMLRVIRHCILLQSVAIECAFSSC